MAKKIRFINPYTGFDSENITQGTSSASKQQSIDETNERLRKRREEEERQRRLEALEKTTASYHLQGKDATPKSFAALSSPEGLEAEKKRKEEAQADPLDLETLPSSNAAGPQNRTDVAKGIQAHKERLEREARKLAAEQLMDQVGFANVGNEKVYKTPFSPLPDPNKTFTLPDGTQATVRANKALAPGLYGIKPDEYVQAMGAFDRYRTLGEPEERPETLVGRYADWTDDQKYAAQNYISDSKGGHNLSDALAEMREAGLTEEQINTFRMEMSDALNSHDYTDERMDSWFEPAQEAAPMYSERQKKILSEYDEALKLLGVDAEQYAGQDASAYYERYGNLYGAEHDSKANPYYEAEGPLKLTQEQAEAWAWNPLSHTTQNEQFDLVRWGVMTQDEKDVYNTILRDYGDEEAKNYLQSIEGDLNQRVTQNEQLEHGQLAMENPFLASIVNPLERMKGAAAQGDMWLEELLTGQAPDEYDLRRLNTRFADSTVANVGQKIEDKVDEAVGKEDSFAGDAASFVYGTAMSLADMGASMLAFGPAGAAAIKGEMFLSAAASTYNNVIDRGGDHNTANAMAGVAGTAELLFESLSIDNLFAIAKGKGLKTAIQNIWRQMKIDASEETATEVANLIGDYILMGDLSTLKQEGAGAAAKEIVLAGIGGALMGGVSGSGAQAKYAVSSHFANRQEDQLLQEAAEARAEQQLAEQKDQDMLENLPADMPVQETVVPEAVDAQKEQHAAADQDAQESARGARQQDNMNAAQDAERRNQEAQRQEQMHADQAAQQNARQQELEQKNAAHDAEMHEKASENASKAAQADEAMKAQDERKRAEDEAKKRNKQLMLQKHQGAVLTSREGTNEPVTVTGVDHVENGTVYMTVEDANGVERVESADEMSFSGETGELLSSDNIDRLDERGVTAYLDNYDAELAGVKEYERAFVGVYERARAGMNYRDAVVNSRLAQTYLTQEAASQAFLAGTARYNTDQVQKQQKRQKFQDPVLNAMNKMAGGKIFMVDSLKGNSMYDKATGNIYIAKDAQKGAYAYYAMHELVHKLKHESPDYWGKFSEMVENELLVRDVDIDAEMAHVRENYKAQGIELDSEGALEEVIANNAPALLQDRAVLEKLVAQDRSVMEKIRDWFESFMDKLHNAMVESGEAMSGLESWHNIDMLKGDSAQLMKMYDCLVEALESTKGSEQKQDVSDTNVVKLSARESKYDPETASIKQQIENSRDRLNGMDVVASVNVPENMKKKDAATKWAVDLLKSTGYRVDRQGFGVITFNEKDIDYAMEYADTPAEKAAIAALPRVLKRGIEIGRHENHDNRNKKTITFAAPVELNGIRGNMAAVVNLHGNHYYTHRIVLPDGSMFKFGEQKKETVREPHRGVTVSSSLADATSTASGPIVNGKDRNVNTVSENFPKNQNVGDGVEIINGSAVKHSLRSWTVQEQERVLKDLIKNGFDRKSAEAWIDDVNSAAAIVASDKARLDFEADPDQVMLKDNQEYYKTLDASTLCAKRLLYQGTFNAIQHRMPNTVMTSERLLDLLNMMKDEGYETPCGICYVESRRRHLGKFAEQWLNGRPASKEQKAWAPYNGSYIPTLDELTTTDGLAKLKANHPETYNDFVKKMSSLGSANPKIVELRTDYRGDIRKISKATAEKIRRIGGLRVQSFSDFETPHMLDMMQAVLDMTSKGLTSQAYTKVPNFAWVFGDTGIKINLSLIAEGNGLDEHGNLIFSSSEGMDINEALRLRDRYSENVGTIIVGANDDHIRAAMADSRIDYIIPFHRSGWGQNELKKVGVLQSYTDYQETQNERVITGYKKNGKPEYGRPEGGNFYPIDYWDYSKSGDENAETYLRMCEEDGRVPKFDQFLEQDADGHWIAPSGYWKMLIDFKMYDNDGNGAPQKAVSPKFNMTEARRVLDEYQGGANELPVAHDIVDRFVAELQAEEADEAVVAEDANTKWSLREDSAGNPLTQEQQEYFADSKVRDENGRLLVMYHGTANAGHTVFDIYGRSNYGLFGQGAYFTEDPSVAQSYTEKGNTKPGKEKGVYEVYLNITNPMDMDAPADANAWEKTVPDATFPETGTNEDFYRAMEEHFRDMMYTKWEAAEDAMETIRGMGYDGITHIGGGRYHKADTNRHRVYIAFDSEQIKNISNKAPTSDPDIRWSLRESDTTVQDELTTLKDLFHLTSAHRMTDKEAVRMARKVKTAAQSTMETEELAGKLKHIYDYVERGGKNASMEEVDSELNALAEEIMATSRTLDYEHEERVQPIRDYLRKKAIKLTDEQRKEAAGLVGNIGTYRRMLFGKVRLSNEGTPLDTLWGELTDMDAELFPADAGESEMAALLLDAVDAIAPVYVNDSGLNSMEAAQWLTGEMNKAYLSLSGVQAAAKESNQLAISLKQYRKLTERFATEHKAAFDEAMVKVKATMDEEKRKQLEDAEKQYRLDVLNARADAKAEYKEEIAQVKANADAKIAKMKSKLDESKAKYRDKLKEKNKGWRKEYRAAQSEKYKEFRDAYRKAMQKKDKEWRVQYREDRKETERKQRYRGQITRMMNELVKLLEHPTDKKHVQDGLRDAVLEFCHNIDLGSSNKATRSLQSRITSLVKAMEDAQKGTEAGNNQYLIDPDLLDTMKEFAEKVKTLGSMNELTADQMREMRNMVRGVAHIVKTADWMFVANRKMRISDAAQSTMAELNRKKDKKKREGFLGKMDELMNNGMLDSFRAFDRMGTTARKMYQNLRDGFDVKVRCISQAVDFVQEHLDGADKDIVKGKKAKKTTYQVRGGEIELTKAQVMELYCLSKRKAARKHLYNGGISTDDHVSMVRITEADVKNITDTLTDSERKLAEALQMFLETECSKWGNETSMTLHGYRKFGEKGYYPMRVDDGSIDTKLTESGQSENLWAMVNPGFGKELSDKANQPLRIGDIFDTFSRHVDSMSSYRAYAAPIADLLRWYNWKPYGEQGIKTMLTQKFGVNGREYIPNLIRDLNMQTKAGYSPGIAEGFTKHAKAAAVGANIRVVIQQPTAIARAAAMMNPKYLAQAMTPKRMKECGRLAKEYCPIAKWKSMGYYETHMGKGLRDLMFGEQGVLEKASDIGMKPAGWADEATWAALWNACEKETRDMHPELSGKALYEATGKRLAEIIDYTQVVDTPFHRSQLMRSKNTAAQMATAFMSEPTKTWNMLQACIARWAENRRDPVARAQMGRTLLVFVATGVLNAAAQSVVDAIRDDDDEEGLLEKYMQAFGGNVLDNLNAIALLPYASDIISIMQGYEPSRMDMQMVQKVIELGKQLFDGEPSDWSTHKWARKVLSAVSYATGVPLENLYRDVTSLYNTVVMQFGGKPLSNQHETANESMAYGNLFDALMDGNTDKWRRIEGKIKTWEKPKSNSDIDSGIGKLLADYDERIAKAWEAKAAGKGSDVQRIRKEVVDELARNRVLDTTRLGEIVDKAITTYGNKVTPKEEKAVDTDAALKVKMYTTKDAVNAVRGIADGTVSLADAKAIMSELVADSEAKEPEKSVRSNVLSDVKKDYLEAVKSGDKGKANKLGNAMQDALGTTQKEMDKWVTDSYADDLRTAVDASNTANAKNIMAKLRARGLDDYDIKDKLSKYRQQYIDAMKSGDRTKANQIKRTLMSLGLKYKDGGPMYTDSTFTGWMK